MANATARNLGQTMTDAERRLWSALRDRRLIGAKFKRRHPIGPFIADFACVELKLVIEADGGQHSENSRDEGRTIWLESQGWQVLRFWNNEILANTTGVLETIAKAIKEHSPPK